MRAQLLVMCVYILILYIAFNSLYSCWGPSDLKLPHALFLSFEYGSCVALKEDKGV
jgi:hypothetical protein